MNGPTHTTRPTDAGFSLMEILMVITIIALLAGLLIGGMSVLNQGAKESQARVILATLSGHVGQLETSLNAPPPQHLSDSRYEWGKNKRYNAPGSSGDGKLAKDDNGVDLAGDENGNYKYSNGDENDVYMQRANLYMMRFIWVANKMPAIRDKLPLLGSAFGDFDGNGFLEVVDPWGNPIAYANDVRHPTPNPLSGINNDTDDDFLPKYAGPFFASAGKDQMWGRPRVRGEFENEADWEAYTKTNDYKFSVDNLYSFDIDRSAATRGD